MSFLSAEPQSRIATWPFSKKGDVLNYYRAAWYEIRDSVEKGVAEADTQQTFVDMLDNDMIKPLVTLNVLRSAQQAPNKGLEAWSRLQLVVASRRKIQLRRKTDNLRNAIRDLNNFRSKRTESLRDGYDCLEELVFKSTINDVLVKYMDGMMSVLSRPWGIFSILTQHAAQHAKVISEVIMSR
ncbi:hypothetical protein EI94DRAFT_1708463 [Lactarius quietus]|nr:hypothetical protein EI94DRAFT_1708463 [Lactarius quietus]